MQRGLKVKLLEVYVVEAIARFSMQRGLKAYFMFVYIIAIIAISQCKED